MAVPQSERGTKRRPMHEVLPFLRSRPLMIFVVIGLATGVTLWALGQTLPLAVVAYIVIGVVIFVTAVGMGDCCTGR